MAVQPSMEWDILPVDLSLPEKFTHWRPVQTQAIEQMLYGSKRFQVLSMPTGSGKSLAVMGGLKLLNEHAGILTGTKGLQDQYLNEFGMDRTVLRVMQRMQVDVHLPLVDIRGRDNYRCSHHPGLTCADGAKLKCKCIGTDACAYSKAFKRAQEADVFVTNYPCWFHSPNLTDNVKVLVLDEGHLAPEQLSSHLRIMISEREILDFAPLSADQTTQGVMLDMGDDITEWRDAARGWAKDVQGEIADIVKKLRASTGTHSNRVFEKLRRQESLYDKLRRIVMIDPLRTGTSAWVCEKFEGHARHGRYWTFDPVWPGSLAEHTLFRGVEKVIIVSATIRPKTMHLLGLHPGDYEYREWPSTFPPNRFPIYSVPVRDPSGRAVKLNYHTPTSELRHWLKVIDDIIGARLDRKGIIHTVSYDRQRYLLDNSRHRHLFIANTADPGSLTAQQTVEQFKRAPAPSILVSPSFGTGYDFPFDECEYQIICKLPFPPMKSKIMKARIALDPTYPTYLTVQDLVQQRGRGCRDKADRCEVFITDEGWHKWFRFSAKPFLPLNFNVRRMAAIPPRPPKL